MSTLTLTKKSFLEMLSGLIASGVIFKSQELTNGDIVIEFTGGF